MKDDDLIRQHAKSYFFTIMKTNIANCNHLEGNVNITFRFVFAHLLLTILPKYKLNLFHTQHTHFETNISMKCSLFYLKKENYRIIYL